jgi:predicted RNA binding protein YcfA (HicA-like mRNA interferase family)
MKGSKIAKKLRRLGCEVEPGGKHLRVTTPSGGRVTLPFSGSDHRGIKNLAAQLRHAGLDVHWKELT